MKNKAAERVSEASKEMVEISDKLTLKEELQIPKEAKAKIKKNTKDKNVAEKKQKSKKTNTGDTTVQIFEFILFLLTH